MTPWQRMQRLEKGLGYFSQYSNGFNPNLFREWVGAQNKLFWCFMLEKKLASATIKSANKLAPFYVWYFSNVFYGLASLGLL